MKAHSMQIKAPKDIIIKQNEKETEITIPENNSAQKTIEINTEFNNTNSESIIIIAQPNSKATIIETTTNKGTSTTRQNTKKINIIAEQGAQINYLNIQNCDSQTNTTTQKKAIAQNNAEINWFECNIGGKNCSSQTTTILKGNNSTTNNNSIFLGTQDQKFEITAESIHEGENTRSEMLTKGALDNNAKAIYKGMLEIKPQASGSSAYQKEDVTLLSPTAEADAVPELKINTNDVKKCTHGASIGQMDEEKLFYMMSRGLQKNDAIKKMLQGFFESILKKTNNIQFNNTIKKLIETKLDIK